ncbi:hypothetical protein [Brucella intermedia]|uniref:hypothetical protein n=1 Tax=Brucella intermedia TaxID=94625 RepID=UPI00235E85C2|nr:hypothetical protein [Brucella intermedia]
MDKRIGDVHPYSYKHPPDVSRVEVGVKSVSAGSKPQHRVMANSASYNAMLEEAYDCDCSEAIVAIQNDQRPDEAEGSKPGQDHTTSSKPTHRTGHQETSEDQIELTAFDLKAGKEASQGTAYHTGNSANLVKNAHDDLMLVSSHMRPVETATHVSFTAFVRLVAIFSRPLWQRRRGCMEDLLRARAGLQSSHLPAVR